MCRDGKNTPMLQESLFRGGTGFLNTPVMLVVPVGDTQ